ncbi:X-ray repair cross-complementing protein 6, partial [Kappamyces sp. JEL0680]
MERGKYQWDGDLDPEDDDDNLLKAAGKSHSVFLIDCTLRMRAIQTGLTISPFAAILKNLAVFLSLKLRAGDSDKLAIVFVGTKHSKSKSAMTAIYTLSDVDAPDVQLLVTLERFLSDPAHFDSLIGSASSFSPYDALLEGSSLLKKSSRHVKKFVYLLTNQDDPYRDDLKAFHMFKIRSQDLVDMSISLEVFGICPSPETTFVHAKCFGRIDYFLYPDEDMLQDRVISCEFDYRAMQTLFASKQVTRKVAYSVPFFLGPKLSLGVRGFNTLMEKKRPTYTLLDGKTSMPVESSTTYICATSSKTLQPEDWGFSYELGGSKAVFSKEEYASMKNNGPPSLTLVGFRDTSELKDKFNLRPSSFLVADEFQITGSSSLFAHFVERLLSRDKIAICKMIAKKNAPLRLVALVPQGASYDEASGKETPMGCHVVTLPFADDLRSIVLPDRMMEIPTVGVLDAASQIVKALSVPYQVGSTKNP